MFNLYLIPTNLIAMETFFYHLLYFLEVKSLFLENEDIILKNKSDLKNKNFT